MPGRSGEGENMVPENNESAEAIERLDDDPERDAFISLADDVGAIVSYEDVGDIKKNAELSDEEVALLVRGAKPAELISMNDEEKGRLISVQERVRTAIRAMTEQ